MERWFSRDLQNFILHYAARDPSKTIRASEIVLNELTDKDLSFVDCKYFIKNEWLYVAKKIATTIQ